MVSRAPKRPVRPGNGNREVALPPPGLLDSPEQVISYYNRMGLDLNTSVPIEQIIQSNPELELKYADLGINDAYIKKISENSFEIGVNKNHHPNRQRFSLAHEYAHYLLHRGKIHSMPEGEQILHRNGERNPVEYQANNFASELLMPDDLVRRAFRASHGNLSQMAQSLRVSKEALKYHLETLGYRVQ